MNLRNAVDRLLLLGLVGVAIPGASLSQGKAAARPSAAPAVAIPVEEIVIVSAPRPPLEPGELVDLGLTYDLGVFHLPPVQTATPATTVWRPGEGPDGKALLNPNRDYRPGWDSTLIPGYSMPYSNSPNDYVEGRTIAYPPGEGRQSNPGAPPTMTTVGGDVPRGPSSASGWNPPLVGAAANPPAMGQTATETPLVPDVHDVPRVSYDPDLPPPWSPPPSAPPKR
jgi:hypothetical protein